MSENLTPQALYEREEAKSDVDHHAPTAGAMTGHIISNLFVHQLKIRQAQLFAKGSARLFLGAHASAWTTFEREAIERLDTVLLSEAEMVPTTSAQILEYGKLDESPVRKYESGEEQLADIVHDFDWQLLFVGKAIALAQKEGLVTLVAALVKLRAWVRAQILETQLFLGNDVDDNLYKEDDDDDEDDD